MQSTHSIHVVLLPQPPPSEEVYPQTSPLPSPASTIESLTREFEHSLDIRSATKGQYVVKPQVSDSFSLDAIFSFTLQSMKVDDMIMVLVQFCFSLPILHLTIHTLS